jgi:hypothetical protein
VPITLGRGSDFVDLTPLVRKLSEALDQSAIAIYATRQVISPLGAGEKTLTTEEDALVRTQT